MRIGQLARASGFPAKTIRYYEGLGLLPEPGREASGYRSYDSSQLRRLELIRLAKTAGLSLSEIADVLSAGTGPGVDCAHAVGLLTEKLARVRLQIAELQQLEAALDHTIQAHNRQELPASVSPDDCPVIERAAWERARTADAVSSGIDDERASVEDTLMLTPARRRHIAPTDPGGEPVCILTAEGARGRRVPIDRLLEHGEMRTLGTGYEIRLPAGDEHWALANAFAEEEADCCAAMAFEVTESDAAVLLVASL